MYRIGQKAFLQLMRASYDAINLEVFCGELPRIPIKIANIEANGYDAFFTTMEKVYFDDSGKVEKTGSQRPRIVVGSHNAYFDDYNKALWPIGLLSHEMIHLYCYLHGIKDCDINQYHNYRFFEVAKRHGMHCKKWHQEYGFINVYMSDDQFNRVIDRIPEVIWKDARDSIKAVSA